MSIVLSISGLPVPVHSGIVSIVVVYSEWTGRQKPKNTFLEILKDGHTGPKEDGRSDKDDDALNLPPQKSSSSFTLSRDSVSSSD